MKQRTKNPRHQKNQKTMSNKYLVLKFRNAKLFRNPKKEDRCFELGLVREAKNEKKRIYYYAPKYRDGFFYKEPITPKQIANVIHVLFNERPVPSRRRTALKSIDYYVEKAMNSYLKIYSDFEIKTKKGDLIKIKEVVKTKKALYNAWSPAISVNWEIVRRYVKPENFQWLVNLLSEILNINVLEYSFQEITDKIRVLIKPKKDILEKVDKDYLGDDLLLKLYSQMKKQGKKGLTSFFNEQKFASRLTSSPEKNAAITVNSGIEFAEIFSGEIIVPVSDDDLKKLKQSKGCATILDDGLVYIDDIVFGDRLDVSEYRKVSDISTELVDFNKK